MRFAGLIMGGAIVGKLLGFVREIEMARILGASIIADSFRGALAAAWLPVAPLQGDTVPAILIPLHRQWRAEGRAPVMYSALTIGMVLVSIVLTVLTFVFAPAWTDLILGGFGPAARALAIRFVRVLSLGMPASVLFNCLVSIEVSLGRARAASLRAPMQNLGLLAGIALTVVTGDPLFIAWCLVIAFTGAVIVIAGLLWREGELVFPARFAVSLATASAEFLRRMRPMLLLPLAEQGNIWLERLLGSAAVVGTLASLDYARNLSETTAYALSQPLGLVMLGRDLGAAGDVHRQVARVVRPLLTVLLPASVLMCFFAPDIVRAVYARGAFQSEAVLLTAHAMQGIACGLWAATPGMVLIRVLNALNRNGAAARIIGASYALNAVVNLALVPHLGSLGLGLGEACRGIALLAGTTVALGCGRLVLREIRRVLPLTAAMVAGSAIIAHVPMGLILRLACIALLYAPVVCITLRDAIPGRVNVRGILTWRNK